MVSRMTSFEELFAIAGELESVSKSPALREAEPSLDALHSAAGRVGRASSGSWLGYHANVYYHDLMPPPPGAHFSQEWGLKDLSITSLGSRGDWEEFDPEEVKLCIRREARGPDLTSVTEASEEATASFKRASSAIKSIILTATRGKPDGFLSKLDKELEEIRPLSPIEVAQIWQPSGQIMTRDMIAMSQGSRVPPHVSIQAEVTSIRQAFNICREAAEIARKAGSHLERSERREVTESRIGTNVFIGHGRSAAWRELKDFIEGRLSLPWDEFNRVPVAGITNQTRLSEMLDAAAIALIIMTAEDEMADGAMQARMNVVHEVGLFQGRLGFTRAVVLLEDGCQEFSNIQGIGQIRFPKGKISACYEEVRQLLEREGLVPIDTRS